MNTEEMIEDYYNAVGSRNFEKVEKYLHPDVQFIAPLAKHSGKEAVLQATIGFTKVFKTLTIRSKFGSKNQAMVVYDLDIPDPIGKISSAALLTFDNGLVTKIELFYDARPFEKR